MPVLGWVARSVTIAMALVSLAAFGASRAAAQQSSLGPHAQWYSEYWAGSRPVPLRGGRDLNVFCMGSGSPTVVLEAGLSESADTWWRVQPEIAKFTRVCGYDRAGYGRSPPGPLPRDTRAETADLEGLLRGSGIKPPYVLVGHSMGGYNVQLFSSRHLRELAGVVLVESSMVDQLVPLEKAIPSAAENDRRAVARGRACADPNRDAKTAADCTPGVPEGFSPELARAYATTVGLPAAKTRLSEIESFIGLDSAEVAAEKRPIGAAPLIVLTRGARSQDLPREQAELEWTLWNGMQKELTTLSTRSEHRVVEGAGHYIQIDQPDAVVKAVSDLVACARNHMTQGCTLWRSIKK